MVVMAVVVFGWVSLQRLALTLMPNMSYPTLTVRTVYPGTAPEEMESVVSRPLEQQLGVIPKLVSISSVSKAGQSDVTLEFQWKTDMDLVSQEVREKSTASVFPRARNVHSSSTSIRPSTRFSASASPARSHSSNSATSPSTM